MGIGKKQGGRDIWFGLGREREGGGLFRLMFRKFVIMCMVVVIKTNKYWE